jgi:hypothetical protein
VNRRLDSRHHWHPRGDQRYGHQSGANCPNPCRRSLAVLLLLQAAEVRLFEPPPSLRAQLPVL